jgi:hypothetical protein
MDYLTELTKEQQEEFLEFLKRGTPNKELFEIIYTYGKINTLEEVLQTLKNRN